MSYFGWYGFADGGREIYDRYIDKLMRFAAYVLDQGHSIRLLAGETTDARAIEDLRQRLRRTPAGGAGGRGQRRPGHCTTSCAKCRQSTAW